MKLIFFKLFFSLALIIVLVSGSQAQFGRKLSAQVFAGTIVSSGNEKLTQAGVAENLFAKYSPGPTLGGAIFYNTSKNLALGFKLRYSYLAKEHFKLNNETSALVVKWNFLPSDKFFSPYIVAEINHSFTGLNQAEYTKTVNPPSTYSVKEENKDIPVTQIEYREPNISLSFISLLGASGGLGVDVRIRETVGLFVQGEFNTSFSKDKTQILKYFPNNKSNFTYILITAGLKFNLFKSKSLY